MTYYLFKSVGSQNIMYALKDNDDPFPTTAYGPFVLVGLATGIKYDEGQAQEMIKAGGYYILPMEPEIIIQSTQ